MATKIYDILFKFFKKVGMDDLITKYIVEIIFVVALFFVGFIIYFVAKKVFSFIFKRLQKRNLKIGKVVSGYFDEQIISKILLLAVAFMLYALRGIFILLYGIFDIVIIIYISLTCVSLFNLTLNKINYLYEKNYKHAKAKPIKGVLSVIKGIVLTAVIIIIISKLIGKSPVYILGAFGAFSAILLLIFKDSILGFVAGFQMSSNDLVRIGDWIEMPKYGADGDVIDISLSFIKVKNWDKTIVTIPAYALVSESFKNWRGMFSTGGRRIKRSINIDVTSIEFCSDKLIKELLEIDFLKDYITERTKEIQEYNKEHKINPKSPINGRRLTNIVVFRKYITEYIKRHPKVHKELIAMVRQLQTENNGVPLEIYAFTNDTAWVNYEDIMSDIFDHIFAVASYFGLKIYQQPSGADIRAVTNIKD